MDPESTTVTSAVPGLLQSQSIGSLTAALAKAHGAMKAPGKGRQAKIQTKDGNSYGYAYADLADVIESYRAELSKNGLAVTQPIIQRDGHMVLFTVLSHTSGEWMASEYPLASYARPQEQGSAITYARRYAVSSLLGIAAEDDDDGKRAQDAEPRQTEAAPVSPDAAAIAIVAGELAQIIGVDPDTICREFSQWTTKEGDVLWFTDPTDRGFAIRKGRNEMERTTRPTEKWLKGVRGKLERELQEKGAKAAVGESALPF